MRPAICLCDQVRVVSGEAKPSMSDAVLTVREQDGLGIYKSAGPQMTCTPQQIVDLIELFTELKRASIEEGLLDG